jgi:hypothetical protein
MEAFALARRDAYGLLPPSGDNGTYLLTSAYTEQAGGMSRFSLVGRAFGLLSP